MPGIEQAAAAVDAVRALLAEAASLPRAAHGELVELLARTAELARLVEAAQVRLACEVAERSHGPVDDSLCRRLGHRSAKEAVASAFGIRARQATDLLTIAAATTASAALSGGELPPRYPRVAEALDDGMLSLAQAQAIVQTLEPAASRADVDELAWAEAALVDAATDPAAPLVPELLVTQARAYVAVLDPDGVLSDAERQRSMRSVRVRRRRDGMWLLTMLSPAESGAAVKALLDAYTGPRVQVGFRDTDEDDGAIPTPDGTDRDAAEAPSLDDRTPAQKGHDVVVGLIRAHAASGDAPSVGGEVPVLVVTGTIEAYDAYVRGAAHREQILTIEHTGDRLPFGAVERLLCDSRVQRVVVDEREHPLHLGRADRLFSRAQRRALAVRDKGCRVPGCGLPPAWCEAHHIRPWQLDGPTDVDNGILLCSYHHHEVHAGRLCVEPTGAGRGSWRVVAQLRPLRSTSTSVGRAAAPLGEVDALAEAAAPSLAVRLPEASRPAPAAAAVDAGPVATSRARASRARPATGAPLGSPELEVRLRRAIGRTGPPSDSGVSASRRGRMRSVPRVRSARFDLHSPPAVVLRP